MKKTILLTLAFTAASHSVTRATDDLLINGFDSVSEAPQWPTDDFPAKPTNAWGRFWGDAIIDGVSMAFDPATDADGNAASGSMKVSAVFIPEGETRQYSVYRLLDQGVIDGTQYASLEMDIRYDPASVTRANGSFGYFELGFKDADWGQIYAFQGEIPAEAGTGWYHISAPIPLTADKIDRIDAIHFKMWGGDEFNGPSTFWVDNVKLTGKPDEELPPPPLDIRPAEQSGLQLVAAGAGIYDRENIRTIQSDYTWVGRTEPVTYALTISEYPEVANFQTHIYFAPGVSGDAGTPDPDWNLASCALVQIGNNADGSGYMNMRYKVNAPSSNGLAGQEYWVADDGVNGGNIASTGSSTMLGRWSITFTSDTDFTMTTPDGSTASGSFSPETAAAFAGDMRIYFGIVPGGEDRQNLAVSLSAVELSGFATPVTETFENAELDSGTWEKVASVPAAVNVIAAAESPVWLTWTLPAPGFAPQASFDMTEFSWTDLPPAAVPTYNIGFERRALINTRLLGLDGQGRAFFRLAKP